MTYQLIADDGSVVAFECPSNVVERRIHSDVLAGKTYPHLPFVDDVHVIFDVGANYGSVSVHFARHYPDAIIHSFEPGAEPRQYLERNVSRYRNVRVHRIGLHSVDQETPLTFGERDTGPAPAPHRGVNLEQSRIVRLRAANAWVAEHDIDRIDILKIHVEGSESQVLDALAPLLPTVKVLYFGYGSRDDRRTIDAKLRPTHDLFRGLAFLDQGECIYLRRDLSAHPGAQECLVDLFVRYAPTSDT